MRGQSILSIDICAWIAVALLVTTSATIGLLLPLPIP